ncbi:uncharacterized protein LOC130445421 isoform X1 [Diorhabda sublineata]|uniref:uncharacterized protein LOC130445421 isoform X1 n=1 Tax=Diorhabda sublineata TaxID=1163346 RepID=UPI0024E16952|nr:uncharacterized protein LOC130445421 isoform X1 [Diorhabda sublineata]XP_056637004.1 uncharacterized protein LOC130445421 isoform X1 [Diorhabda sublineata]
MNCLINIYIHVYAIGVRILSNYVVFRDRINQEINILVVPTEYFKILERISIEWTKEWVSLYEDSTFAWYTDKCLSKLKGCIRIGDAPEFFAVGEWTKVAPTKPKFSRHYNVGQLLVIGSKKRDDIHWFAAPSSAEMNDWLTAISNTLPPPPPTTETRDGEENFAKKHDNSVLKNTMRPKKKILTEKRCDCYNLSPSQKKNRNYDADYTPLSAACIDWGHGWGWGQNAFLNTSIYNYHDAATITHTTNYIYSPPVEDYTYSYSGLEDVDWGIADLIM